MSNLIRGKNILMQIKITGVWYNLLCAKSGSLTSQQEEIETTDINAGASRKYVPGMRSHTAEVSGITTSDNTGQRVSILYLMAAAQRRTIFEMRMHMTDEDGNINTLDFSAFSTTLTVSRDFASFSNSSAAFRITGDVVPAVNPPPPDPPACETQDPLYIDGAEGESSVSNALLEVADVVILGVSRSGQVHSETTGTPGNLEYKFNAGTGSIEFDPTNPFNPGGEQVWILYKIDA